MVKVGQIVMIPTGSYCNITLDSGEKIIVNHEPGGRTGSARALLSVDRLRLLDLSSETVVRFSVDTAEAEAVLAQYAPAEAPGTPGSLLRAFVTCIQGCRSVADVVVRCRELQRENG